VSAVSVHFRRHPEMGRKGVSAPTLMTSVDDASDAVARAGGAQVPLTRLKRAAVRLPRIKAPSGGTRGDDSRNHTESLPWEDTEETRARFLSQEARFWKGPHHLQIRDPSPSGPRNAYHCAPCRGDGRGGRRTVGGTRRYGRPRTTGNYDALKQVRSIKAKAAQLRCVKDVLDDPASRETKGLEKVRRDLKATMTLGETPTPEVAAKALAEVGQILSVV